MTELIEFTTGLTLITAGIFSSLALIERLVGVIEENVKKWDLIIRWGGFLMGLIALFVSLLLIIDSGEVINIAFLTLVGLALTLRPIKSIPWAALLGMIIGLGICVVYILFFQRDVNEDYRILALIFFGITLLFYISLKFFEDLGQIFGELLSAPPVAIPLGLICIIQGILIIIFPPDGILQLI
ncbi:MAG: hypothetical protein ACFFCQ_01790 [Promethearchaeota archaeon]